MSSGTSADNVAIELPWTGERMVPGASDARTFWEHVARYRFSTRYARGKRVLDVACGEGYGAHALARAGALDVLAVDVSLAVCQHVQAKYGVRVCCADACALPLPAESADLVVSFETIEHLATPDVFVRECARVLRTDGVLIISTPNRDVFGSDGRRSEFHHSEMTAAEFNSVLHRGFETVQLYSQRPDTASGWSLTALAAVRSPWLKLRWFGSLRRRALAWTTEGRPLSKPQRGRAVEAILRHQTFAAKFVHPHGVRRSSLRSSERACYVLAVCRAPRL